MISISVVLASYNGEKYIRLQIQSIINQMKETDELIITDDGSTDNTISIISEFAQDKRVRLFNGPHMGFTKNFENGLLHTTKDIILFADQDDYWMNNKLDTIRTFFENNPSCWLVSHDQYLATNEEIYNNHFTTRSFDVRRVRHGLIYNILKSGYYGCCMGITKEFKDMLLPFPDTVNQHDQWISIVAEYFHKSYLMNEVLIAHRIHSSNFSCKRSVAFRIRFRYLIVISLITTVKRIRAQKRSE